MGRLAAFVDRTKQRFGVAVPAPPVETEPYEDSRPVGMEWPGGNIEPPVPVAAQMDSASMESWAKTMAEVADNLKAIRGLLESFASESPTRGWRRDGPQKGEHRHRKEKS